MSISFTLALSSSLLDQQYFPHYFAYCRRFFLSTILSLVALADLSLNSTSITTDLKVRVLGWVRQRTPHIQT